ncbi:MAG: phosphatase PAP2 family protein [Firmicutes bacterium]|nr:phosphatase PAP2 family protein [Bacillota bacterium]
MTRIRRRLLAASLTLLGGVLLSAALLLLIHSQAPAAGAPWERALLLGLHRRVTPALWQVAYDVSLLGYPPAIAAVTLLTLLVWGWRRAFWKAGFLLAAVAGLSLLNYGGKPFFHRPRPALFPHPFVAGSAFPSGHALFAVGFYGVLAYLAVAGRGRAARLAGWAAWLVLALALGLSRLVLGVHWPTDVAAGYAAGGVVLAADVVAARRWRARGEAAGGAES